METIIVFAIILFGCLIAVEFTYGLATKHNTYRLNDTISSLSQGALSQVVAIFTRLFQIGIYTLIFSSATQFHQDAFWIGWAGLLIAVILYDFCDYWLHRMSHEVAVLWAAHVVHHQSQAFNFTTALRQESLYPVLGFVFFIPLAILGVPPTTFAIAGLVVLFYQFWIHTEHIGKLGWFDRVFASPSNHRVHHAVNPPYIDKNYGAILIIWDRLFGTFAEESEPCTYGTITPLNSWDPLWAASHVFFALLKASLATRRWSDKLKIWFMPPGWQPPDLQQQPQRLGSPAKQTEKGPLYDPLMQRSAVWFTSVHAVLSLAALGLYLWYQDHLSTTESMLIGAQIIAGLWIVGAVMQGRLKVSRGVWLDLALIGNVVFTLYFYAPNQF